MVTVTSSKTSNKMAFPVVPPSGQTGSPMEAPSMILSRKVLSIETKPFVDLLKPQPHCSFHSARYSTLLCGNVRGAIRRDVSSLSNVTRTSLMGDKCGI